MLLRYESCYFLSICAWLVLIYPPVTGQLRTLQLNNQHISDYDKYFAVRGICVEVFGVFVDFFEFLSTKLASYSEPPSRDNHRKASYPRTQKRDQGAG